MCTFYNFLKHHFMYLANITAVIAYDIAVTDLQYCILYVWWPGSTACSSATRKSSWISKGNCWDDIFCTACFHTKYGGVHSCVCNGRYLDFCNRCSSQSAKGTLLAHCNNSCTSKYISKIVDCFFFFVVTVIVPVWRNLRLAFTLVLNLFTCALFLLELLSKTEYISFWVEEYLFRKHSQF